jgi:starch synthase
MSLSILTIGSEALPFSKTGGLADVLGALPLALGRLGHHVTLVTPKYRGTRAQGTTRTIRVGGIDGVVADTRVTEQPLAENVKAVLVDRPELYDRESLYGVGGDYPDSPPPVWISLCRGSGVRPAGRSARRHPARA